MVSIKLRVLLVILMLDHVKFGRNRESVADIEHELHLLFLRNPNHWLQQDGVPLLRVNDIPGVLHQWAADHDMPDLLNDAELEQFVQLLDASAKDGVPPGMVMGLIAVRGKENMEMETNQPEQADSPSPEGHHSRSSSSESRGSTGDPPPVPGKSPIADAPES